MKNKFFELSKLFNQYRVGKTFNDLTKDSQLLANSNILISSPEGWEVLSRRWKARKGFN
jgi:hypothetical protein